MHKLTLTALGDDAYCILTDQGAHVGNLKFINGVWKFKAIGYDPNGEVIPGGGPLTDRHNTVFVTFDATLVGAALAQSCTADDAWSFSPLAVPGKLA